MSHPSVVSLEDIENSDASKQGPNLVSYIFIPRVPPTCDVGPKAVNASPDKVIDTLGSALVDMHTESHLGGMYT